jgi:hypothetical protein
LQELDFDLTDSQVQQLATGKDFVQLKNGPFDLDLIFAPDGIERFSGTRAIPSISKSGVRKELNHDETTRQRGYEKKNFCFVVSVVPSWFKTLQFRRLCAFCDYAF